MLSQDLELLLAERGVVVLRDQHITPEEQLEFGRRFAGHRLHVHPVAQIKGFSPELIVVHSNPENPATADNW